MKKCYQLLRTAKSPDPVDIFWGIGQEVGPIGDPICIDEPDLTDAELIAAYYRPWSFATFRWGLKLGPLTVYVYPSGIGWTSMAGQGHELRWRAL